MSIQRYGLSIAVYESDEQHIEKQKNGDYVLFTTHAAEVERLTAELQMHKLMRHEACVECGRLAAEIDQNKIDINELTIERDAAIARAERAEEALRHLINKSNRVTSAANSWAPASSTASPLRLSVDDCRRIKREVDRS